MADYLAQRIIDGRFTYKEVVTKKPNLKEGVNAYLKLQDRIDLITE